MLFRHAVFLDPGLFRHFGSEEKVIEALRIDRASLGVKLMYNLARILATETAR